MGNPVVDLLHARGASRAFAATPLDGAIVDELVEAVRLTPSCYNNQPWRFLFCESEDARARGAECLAGPNRVWAERAPLLVFGHTRREDDCVLKDGRAYHEFDLGLATMNLMLVATHHGLLARPMAGFSPGKVRDAFGLDEDQAVLIAVAIGPQSDDESHLPEDRRGMGDQPRERKAVGEIVRRL